MSGWRDETAADLADAASRLEAAMASISGEPSREHVLSVWMAYLKVEKSVAFIKLDLDEENPGRFVMLKQYAVPDERQALKFALSNLKKGSDSFALGDVHQSLKWLRESRNYLRAFLRAKRLKRARGGRPSLGLFCLLLL